MAPEPRRYFGWFSLCSLLAVVPLTWLATPGQAEERKFVVMLADLPKDEPGQRELPNPADIWDAYFDKTKNAEPGQPGDRVDSFAEWWEEVSYGDVTVTGNAYGWVQMPWPSEPEETDASGTRFPHIDLNGDRVYSAGDGEPFFPFVAKFEYDFDGVGENFAQGNAGSTLWFGLNDRDPFLRPVYAPGERFLDLNDNDVYDAGVWEWGLDKDGDGEIDVDKPAFSAAQLYSADVDYTDPENPVFVGWNNDTEWFDSNGDGLWNVDGRQFVRGFGPQGVVLVAGDWGGRELWTDRNGDFEVGSRAEPDEGEQRATFQEFIFQVHDPEDDDVEYFDEQWNENFDFAEPFEDFLRRWDSFSNDFIQTTEDYIVANYPGDVSRLIARIGNGRYNSPDSWSNNHDGTINSTNKLQEMLVSSDDSNELAEQDRRNDHVALPPEFYGPIGWSLEAFWQDFYGTSAPDWLFYRFFGSGVFPRTIPYLRRFDPTQPIPKPLGAMEDPPMPFDPDRGGPFGNGRRFEDQNFYTRDDGTMKPEIDDRDEGMYDGPREFHDLPSSIYHRGGDEDFGEITGPETNQIWGDDIGPHTPNLPSTPDTAIPAAGPLAFLVHGDGGWDAGNVLSLEYLTWRTDGTSVTDVPISDGIGGIARMEYHKDTNLDGMMDLGETPGTPGAFRLPNPTMYHNYGLDGDPGTPPDGGPSSFYPFNRERLVEDAVEALDDTVDWDEFLGGPLPWGDRISGVVLVSDRTDGRMFRLPAASVGPPIRTRDRINPGEPGLDHFTPIPFFDGLGITIGAFEQGGEGFAFLDQQDFRVGWSCHEWAHTWEGFPDLYDYDVTRGGFGSAIINNPIGRWCIMANGGQVHPVPVLKWHTRGGTRNSWLTPVDITQALIPAGEEEIEIRAWEFDRDKTVFVYESALVPGEEFWLWRNNPGVVQNGLTTRLAMDHRQPAFGLIIMHVDRSGNPESIPNQQRIGTHFAWEIVQADGLQQLNNGENVGDPGDPWPGSTNAQSWNRNSDPSNRWWNSQGGGLDIVGVRHEENSSFVTIAWTPQELPTLRWVQPPGGVSVNGNYQLRYFAYDQHGGTTIQFFAVRSQEGVPLTYENGIPMGSTGKTPGDVDGVFSVSVRSLNDGTYSFFAKLIPGVGADGKRENWNSVPRGNFNNVGNGTFTVDGVDAVISKFERWTATVVSDQPVGAETWRVDGSVSGVQAGLAVTSVQYRSDPELGSDNVIRNAITFTIRSGNLPFRAGDTFTLLTTGLTPHSDAVLVSLGNVVEPQPPVAVARVENGVTSGLAPLDVIFRHHDSRDPHGAALTFDWDFGDSTPGVQTTDPARPVTHTYTVPNMDPYVATLTVTNAFGLDDTAEIPIQVNAAAPPTVRATADLVTGIRPLRVRFTGDLTTDPNAGLQGLDFVWDFGDGSPLAMTANAEHIYQNAGNYLVTLTVTNRPFNESASTIIEIRVIGPAEDQPPVAGFEVDRLSGQTPLTVLFDGNISIDPEGGVLEYLWNFDDGLPVIRGVSEIEHTFTNAGTYNVTLTVVDESNQLDRATKAIVAMGEEGANEGSPVARIVASATQGPAPFTVAFDAGNSVDPQGGPLSFAWDFGDGSEQEVGEFVTHTFTAARRYTVVLAVSDVDGNQGATTIEILVTVAAGDDAGAGIADFDTVIPEINNCGTTCGPVGMLPMMWTLIGIGGIRRMGRRFRP